jgi:uncharacterized protein (DUF1015 family)
MTKVKPFKAIVYNQGKIDNLAEVICPPYDIISPAQQEYYHQRSRYNLIHILLGQDIPADDKYRRAANYFKEWLKDKIFIQDEKPGIYFYSQQYNFRGETKTRLGFIALLGIAEGKQTIFGHERTRLEPKEDRLKLLKSVKANLSPIFVIFQDKKRIVQTTYQQFIAQREPIIEIVDEEKIVHRLWRLDQEDLLEKIQTGLKDANIFIADGHHRYEVASNFRDEMKKKLDQITGEEDFNYVMAYFTNIESNGLTILPIHRLVKLTANFALEDFRLKLKEHFAIEEIKDRTRLFFLMEKAGRSEHVFGMYKDKRYWLLRLKNVKIIDKMINERSPVYRSLDVSILNYLILKEMLGIALEDKERILFSARADELIERVDNESSYIGFFLNPVKMKQIMSIALSGDKMPAKSTYFYPKPISGLTINKIEV